MRQEVVELDPARPAWVRRPEFWEMSNDWVGDPQPAVSWSRRIPNAVNDFVTEAIRTSSSGGHRELQSHIAGSRSPSRLCVVRSWVRRNASPGSITLYRLANEGVQGTQVGGIRAEGDDSAPMIPYTGVLDIAGHHARAAEVPPPTGPRYFQRAPQRGTRCVASVLSFLLPVHCTISREVDRRDPRPGCLEQGGCGLWISGPGNPRRSRGLRGHEHSDFAFALVAVAHRRDVRARGSTPLQSRGGRRRSSRSPRGSGRLRCGPYRRPRREAVLLGRPQGELLPALARRT